MPLLLNHLLKINLNMTESPSLPLLLRKMELKGGELNRCLMEIFSFYGFSYIEMS